MYLNLELRTPVLSEPITREIPTDVINFLMQAGQQAPSGENTQPWFIKYRKNTILIQLDPTADPSLYNVKQIASAIACGGVATNICIAATEFGLASQVEVLEAHDEQLYIAITLKPSNVDKSRLTDAVWQRHTNRTKFNSIPIPIGDLNYLQQVCSKINGASLDLFTKKSDIKYIAKIIRKTDILRMQIQSLHNLLVSHIHFNADEALKSKVGMPIQNLEAGWGGEIFLKITKPWKVANLMNKIGMAHIAAAMVSKGAKQASAMAMIRIKGQDIHSFFRGGQALQNVWLEATRLGISFQPMTISTFLWMNWQFDRTAIFNSKHQQLLNNIWKDYQKIFHCGDNETHILLFRLGYGQAMKARTLRKNINLPCNTQ